jgi:hypothetical protein
MSVLSHRGRCACFLALGCFAWFPASGAGWHLTGQPRGCRFCRDDGRSDGMPGFNLAVSVRLAVARAVVADGQRLYRAGVAAAL